MVRFVRDVPVIDQLEVGACARREVKARGRQKLGQSIALRLVERRQLTMMLRMLPKEIRVGKLGRMVRAEGHVLVNLTKFRRERGRRHAVADLPSRGVVGLPEGRHHEAPGRQLGMAQHAFVALPIENNVLVNLIGEDPEAVVLCQGPKAQQRRFGKDRARGVVRGIDHHGAGSGGQHRLQRLKVDLEARGRKRQVHGRAPGHHHRGIVGVIGRIEDHHLVPRAYHRLHGAEERFRGTGGDGDFPVRIHDGAVIGRNFLRQGLPQRRGPHHGRVLIGAVMKVMAHPIEQGRGPVKIREALGKVQGSVGLSQLGHHGENSRSHRRQLARKRW